MANVDFRFGLRPVGHLLGLNWSASVRKCYIPSTDSTRAFFIGDPVNLAGAADASGECPTVTVSNAGLATYPIFGVIVAFEPDPDNLTLLYRPDDTARYCYVCCDPFVIYEVQGCSNSVIPKESVGLNAIMVATHSGNTATGLSGMELDSGVGTAPAVNSTYPLMILGAAPRPDNDIASVNAKWHVYVSMHRLTPNWSPTDAAHFGARGA